MVYRGKVYDLAPGEAWLLPANATVERRCEVVFFRFFCECLPGVFHYIEDHLGADLRLADLEEVHGSTPAAFTRSTGISPNEYLTRRLNQEAIR